MKKQIKIRNAIVLPNGVNFDRFRPIDKAISRDRVDYDGLDRPFLERRVASNLHFCDALQGVDCGFLNVRPFMVQSDGQNLRQRTDSLFLCVFCSTRSRAFDVFRREATARPDSLQGRLAVLAGGIPVPGRLHAQGPKLRDEL